MSLSRGRIRMLAVVLLVAFGLLGARAVFLGTVRADELGDQALRQQRSAFAVEAPRGSILTRDAQVLARDELAMDVSGAPFVITDPRATAEALAPILARDVDELTEELDGSEPYVPLASELRPELARKVEALDLTGIHVRDTYRRVLPRGPLAAQVVGLTDRDGNGLSGLESQYDDDLKGVPGARVEAHDPLGRPLKVIENSDPQPGAALRLTIHSEIQDRAQRVLEEARRRHDAASATVIVMRPRDGAILAMASAPGFNPNKREAIDEELARNRAVTDPLEPGSTFKAITMAGALETKTVTPKTRFQLPSTVALYDRVLGEAHPRPAVNWNVAQILERSSNVGTYKVAEKLGAKRMQRWITRFGFGQPTGIDFPGEAGGLVLPLDEWSGTTILNVPIGHGIGITPVQLASAYATIANGGTRVTPHLAARVGDRRISRPTGKRVISRGTARQLDRMLRGVVGPDGTGQAANVVGFTVAGKTGTANKVDPEIGEYSDSKYFASFVGYAPAERPQLLVAVIVDEPSTGIIYGGEVAAPPFEQIMNFSLQKLEIVP
jgi:cell division protein FtsI (penicillin-binding protein 3)